MSYRVEITRAAQRDLRRIPRPVRDRIETAIRLLSNNPFPHGSVKLRGADRTWRLRHGRFRVLYEVHSDILLVMIVKVARRSESTYRR